MRGGKTVQLAIVGCGGIAGAHLRGYQHIKGKEPGKFEVVALCDVVRDVAERRAVEIEKWQGFKPRVYTDLDEMLSKEELDGADICTSHAMHHVAAVACLNGGVSVMVEKPIGVTVKATKAIVEAAKKNGKIAATAEQIRRQPLQRTAHWLFNENKLIGEPRLFFAQHATFEAPASEHSAPRWAWRYDRSLSGGGMVMDSGAHFCDTIRYLFGDVDTVYAKVEQLIRRPFNKDGQIVWDEREDTWLATLTFKSGLIGFWSLTTAAPGYDFTHVVYYGTEGALVDSGDVFHGPFEGAFIRQRNGRVRRLSDLQGEFMESLREDERNRLFPHGFTDGFTLECYDFLDAIQHNHPPEIPAEEGLKAKAIAEAIYESAHSGQAVKVQDVIDGKIEGYQSEINERWGI